MKTTILMAILFNIGAILSGAENSAPKLLPTNISDIIFPWQDAYHLDDYTFANEKIEDRLHEMGMQSRLAIYAVPYRAKCRIVFVGIPEDDFLSFEVKRKFIDLVHSCLRESRAKRSEPSIKNQTTKTEAAKSNSVNASPELKKP